MTVAGGRSGRTSRRLLAGAACVLFYSGLLAVAVDAGFGDHVAMETTTGAGTSTGGPGASTTGADAAATAGGADAPAGGTEVGPSQNLSGATGAAGTAPIAGGGSGVDAAGGGGAVPVAPPSAGITIGVEIDHDNSAAYNAIGAKGVSTGDQGGEVRAVVAWINRNGGMGGRKVTPVIHESQEETSTFAAQAQATCADFTEDHKVFAAVGRTSDRDDLFRCLSPRGVPLVAQNRYLWDRQVLDASPGTLYVPGGLGGGRWDQWVATLGKAGYFEKGAKYGVVRFDTPPYERTYRGVVEPALRAAGASALVEVVVHQPEAVSAFGSMNGELANAVLRLRQQGVDHVMILDEATIAFFFMPQAESQSYRPRYGMHSQNIPQVLSINVPAAQLHRAVGGGWVPTLDVDFPQDPGGSPGAARCGSIYHDAGINFSDRVTQSFAMRFCDSLLFLKAGLDRAPNVSVRGLQQGVDALGAGHQSALTFSAVFGPGRHDGANVIRPFAFDDGCRCFRYTGEVR